MRTLFPIEVNNSVGFLDRNGAIVLKPRIHYVWSNFHDGRAMCRNKIIYLRNKKLVKAFMYGFIDETGEIVIEPKFGHVEDFRCGLTQFSFVRQGIMGFADRFGNIVIQPRFDRNDIDWFQEDLLRVLEHGMFGFIDTQGNWKLPPQYAGAGGFSEGLVAINVGGSIVNESERGTFWETLGGKWGFVDKKGRVVIPPQFENVGEFSDGLCRVVEGVKTGFINQEGRFAIQPQFDWATEFSDGVAKTSLDGKISIIDTNGKILFEPRFESISRFHEGMARFTDKVGNERKTGFINLCGEVIVSPQFTLADDFWGGLAEVYHPDWRGYIDQKGKVVWRTENTKIPA